jgi:putative nucleotidyltransferase with HDIG domain
MGMSGLLKVMKELWNKLYLHSANVANLSLRIGDYLHLNEEDQKTLIKGALLHDVGKMFINREIIDKPGPLNEKEWVELKKHPWLGAFTVAEKGGDSSLVEIIRYHHERWDGRGYEGIQGEQIPLCARIIALADSLDSMTAFRPYRLPLKVHEALEEVYNGAGSQFDPHLTTLMAEKPFLQSATYCDPDRIERQIEEERDWLTHLTNSYVKLSHPLVYAQSQWLARLIIISNKLQGCAASGE